MSPDTTMRAAGLMAKGASTMLNRTNTLVNGHSYGWSNHNDNVNVNGTPSIREPASQMLHHDNVIDNDNDGDI